MERLQTGLKHTSTTTVTPELTAKQIGSGELAVYATPAMTALMENAAMLAVKPAIGEDETTVGSMISTTHLHPSPVGAKIKATAELVGIEGRKLTFAVAASDEKGTIGEGTHIRYVVNRERFMKKA